MVAAESESCEICQKLSCANIFSPPLSLSLTHFRIDEVVKSFERRQSESKTSIKAWMALAKEISEQS